MKIDCYKIVVDCQYNDEVDIRCGGPYSLGYDFFVEKSQVEEMIDFVKETCEKLGVPILALYYDKLETFKKEQNKVWTKEKIYKCIENNEAGLDLDITETL